MNKTTGLSLDYIFKRVTGKTVEEWISAGELYLYPTYANGYESGLGILAANWNQFPRKGNTAYNWSKRGKRFGDLLERIGYKLEWSDQTLCCSHCYGAINEETDYCGDSAHYVILGDDNDVVCEDCICKDSVGEYLEGLEDNPSRACSIRRVDPEEHGYRLIESGFENGFYPGQTDKPIEIAKRLYATGHKKLLFAITRARQFDIRFAVYEKIEDESEE